MENEEKRSSLQRVLQLLDKVPSVNGAALSTKQLHGYMLETGYNISKRSVERNLKELEELGYVEFETPDSKTYLWKKTYLSTKDKLSMEPSSALLVVLAEQLLVNTLPPGSWDALEDRFKQAHNTLDNSTRNKLRRWQDKVFYIQGSHPSTPNSINTEIRKVIYESILNEEQIEITYQSKRYPQPKEYTLNPLAVAVRDEKIYLVATKDESPTQLQIFHLHRILCVAANYRDMSKVTKNLNMQNYLATNPTGAPISKEIHTISIKARNYAYDWFCRNRLDGQTISPIEGDNFHRITFRSNVTHDLLRLVLRYSPDIVVESPEELKTMVMEKLKESLKLYENAGINCI